LPEKKTLDLEMNSGLSFSRLVNSENHGMPQSNQFLSSDLSVNKGRSY